MDSKFVVIAFVDAINSRDQSAIEELLITASLADDEFTPILPDYKIKVDHIICDCQKVVLLGSAVSCYEVMPAVWVAQLCGQRIVDWQVYFNGTTSCAN